MKQEHESFLRPFFQEMNEKFSNNWCVLHSYETLPYFSVSDVDMAFSGKKIKDLESIIYDVANESGWTIYQKLWYDVQKCFYYVLKNNISDIFLAIDFLIDNNGIGRYGFKTSLLTHKCDFFDGFIPIPNSEIAFCYKFVKRVEKKIPIVEDEKYLLSHYRLANHKKIAEIMIDQFGVESWIFLKENFLKENFLLSRNEIDFLINAKYKLFKKNINYLKKIYWESFRILNRVFFPCGIIIEIPDLSNKELDNFLNLLKTKIGLSFRFIKLNINNSKIFNFKGLIGSTLVVCRKKDLTKKISIRTHWLHSKSTINLNNDDLKNMELFANKCYSLILEELLRRNKFKKKKYD